MEFIFSWKKDFTSERSDMSALKIEKNRRIAKENKRNDVSDIFTSEDMANISLVSRM